MTHISPAGAQPTWISLHNPPDQREIHAEGECDPPYRRKGAPITHVARAAAHQYKTLILEYLLAERVGFEPTTTLWIL
jgi:hypothetical protein